MGRSLRVAALALMTVGTFSSGAQTPVAVTPPRGTSGGSSGGGLGRPPSLSGSGALPVLVKWRIHVAPATPRVGEEVHISFPRAGSSFQNFWPMRVSFGPGASLADDFLGCDALGLNCPSEVSYRVTYGSPGEKVVKLLWSTWSQGDFTSEARFQVVQATKAAVSLSPTPPPPLGPPPGSIQSVVINPTPATAGEDVDITVYGTSPLQGTCGVHVSFQGRFSGNAEARFPVVFRMRVTGGAGSAYALASGIQFSPRLNQQVAGCSGNARADVTIKAPSSSAVTGFKTPTPTPKPPANRVAPPLN